MWWPFKKKDFKVGDIVFYNDDELDSIAEVEIMDICGLNYEVKIIDSGLFHFWSKRMVNRYGHSWPKAPKCPPPPDKPDEYKLVFNQPESPLTFNSDTGSNYINSPIVTDPYEELNRLKHMGMLRQGVKPLSEEQRSLLKTVFRDAGIYNTIRRR